MRRRRGKRIEAEKKAAKLLAREQGKMWRRLTGTKPKKEDNSVMGYKGNVAWAQPVVYAPYGPGIGDCTA